MEVINFDENTLINQSFKRNINHLYSLFYEDENAFQVVSIAEYYDANKSILKSYNNGSLRDKIEIVPFIYKTCMLPNEEEYNIFRSDYFKQIILSYLFGQNLPFSSYKINRVNNKLLKPNSNNNYENMVSNKMEFNGSIITKEELIKFLFQYYMKDILNITKMLSDNQPEYFGKIKEITYRNIQPNNITSFMNIVVTNYKRIIELYKIYDSDDIKKRNIKDELLKEREELIKKIENIDDKIDGGNEKGKSLTFSSGKASAKLFMDNDGFVQNLLFIFLVGLTSGLSFFFISSLVKFILNRI